MKTKICSKCGQELSLGEFHKGNGKYGRAAWCKRCVAAYNATPKVKASRRIYKVTPKGKAAKAKYEASPKGKAAKAKYEASPKGKAVRVKINAKRNASPKGKAASAKYEASPKGKAVRVKAEAKYRASPEGKVAHRKANAKYQASLKGKGIRAEWYASPEGKAAKRRSGFKRRSRFNIDPKLNFAGEQKLLKIYDHRCAYCGAPKECFDHIWPVSKGGKDEIGNVIPACTSCNGFKYVKLPHELPSYFQKVIKRHAELLGAASIPIIEQERLYAQF